MQQIPTDGTVSVQFGVQIPEMQDITRSMTSQKITSLQLVVFDEHGYFVEAVDATVDGGATWPDEETPKTPSAEQTYSVVLTQSTSPRIIHFIANSPVASEDYDYGSERELINALETSMYTVESGNVVWPDAYWQRKQISSVLGNVVEELEDGTKKVIADEKSKLADDLNQIPLVRNFAKVSVDDEDVSNVFTNVQIAVYNVPLKGKVAPYNTNAGEYAVYNATTTYASLTTAGYYGYEPTLTENDFVDNAEFADVQYLYEYNMSGKSISAGSKYPFVIISGNYRNEGTSYYKVDLTDGSGNYYNILRNFNYVIKIDAVSSSGYSSAADAAKAAASNNISASIDTRNLLNISDGISRLYVEYTTKYIVSADENVTLKYKYVPDIDNATTYNNAAVTMTVGTGDVFNGQPSKGTAADAEGWATITINPKAISNTTKTQTITLTAGTLSRTVTFISLSRYPLTVDCPDEAIDSEVGESVPVKLILPEALPQTIFPLEFVIVSDKLSISPDASTENMPVKTGLNKNGEEVEGGQHFGFVKTIEWDDYVNLDADGNIESYDNEVVCNFKTSVVNNASVVRAYNPYFTEASDRFRNAPGSYTYNIEAVLGANAAVYGAGHDVTLDITLPDAPAGVSVRVETTGFNIVGTRATGTYATDENGMVKLMLETTAWGGTRTVKVSCASQQPIDNGWDNITYKAKTVSVTASKLNIPAGSFRATSAPTGMVYVTVGGSTSSEAIPFNSDGKNAAATVTIPGLDDEDSDANITLSYTDGSGNTYAASTTVAKAKSSNADDITFTVQYVTVLKIGNIDSATAPNYALYSNKDVTIYIKSKSNGQETNIATKSIGSNGPSDNSDITVSEDLKLNANDMIYFKFTNRSTTYYASIKISDLNSGPGQSLDFTTTNPL